MVLELLQSGNTGGIDFLMQQKGLKMFSQFP